MKAAVRQVLVLWGVSCIVAGCESSQTAPEPEYEDISGSYSALVNSSNGAVTLTGSLSFTIMQNRGDLSGTWAGSYNVAAAGSVVPFQGAGSFAGTIQAGRNPSVRLMVQSAGNCAGEAGVYAGSYESATRILRLTGPFELVGLQCETLASLTLTLVLQR